MAAKRRLKATSAAASVTLENAVSGMRWKAVAPVVSSESLAVASEKAVKRPRKSASDVTVASASSDGAACILSMPSHAASTHDNESTACESACLRVPSDSLDPSDHRSCCYLSSSISAASYRSSVVGEASATAETSVMIRHESPSTIRVDESMAECHGVRQTNTNK